MISTDAIVVANAGDSGSLTAVNGRPAAAHLIDTLQSCGAISRVVLVCDNDSHDQLGCQCTHVAARGAEADDLMAGIQEAWQADRCLVMAGDMPLATAEAVDDLLANAPDADVVYPVVSRADVESVFPERVTAYLTARDGQYTGSSCLLFRPGVALAREDLISGLMQARQNPSSLVKLVGPWVGLKLAISKPSLVEIAEMLSDALRLDCRVFLTHYPELLFSIETSSDIELARSSLR